MAGWKYVINVQAPLPPSRRSRNFTTSPGRPARDGQRILIGDKKFPQKRRCRQGHCGGSCVDRRHEEQPAVRKGRIRDVRKVKISTLYPERAASLRSPGFTSEGMKLKITFISSTGDSALSRLSNEQLAEHSTLLKRLLFSAAPHGPAAEAQSENSIAKHSMVHEQMTGSTPGSAATRIPWRSW